MELKPAAALLSLVLLELPLRAAAQTPKPPESVHDLKGEIRHFVISANDFTRTLCNRAFAASDEASLQKILDEVEEMFKYQAFVVLGWREEIRRHRESLKRTTDDYWDHGRELGRAKAKYGQALARSIVLEQVRERVRGCVGIAVDALRQPSVTAGTGTGAGRGTGGGPGGQGAELCQSQAGPIGCTGRFSGTYQVECSDGSGPPSRDAGRGWLTFAADGSVEVQLQGGTSPLVGRIDRSGYVMHDESDPGFSERWEGRFSVQPVPGGSRPVGGGTYTSRLTGPQGQLENACKGTFTLSGPPL